MGTVVFGDETKRLQLNSILHPFIIERQDEMIRHLEQQNPNGIAVVDAALMIESGGYQRFDKLIVVHCRPEVQLERLMTRGLSREEGKNSIAAQMSQDEKKKHKHFLIVTSYSLNVVL